MNNNLLRQLAEIEELRRQQEEKGLRKELKEADMEVNRSTLAPIYPETPPSNPQGYFIGPDVKTERPQDRYLRLKKLLSEE